MKIYECKKRYRQEEMKTDTKVAQDEVKDTE